MNLIKIPFLIRCITIKVKIIAIKLVIKNFIPKYVLVGALSACPISGFLVILDPNGRAIKNIIHQRHMKVTR